MKLFITAKTRARKAHIEEIDPIHLIVSVKEAPIEGKANAAIVKLLARHFGVPQSNVRIIAGLQSKEKVIDIRER